MGFRDQKTRRWAEQYDLDGATKIVTGTIGNFVSIATGGDINDSNKVPPTGDVVGTSDSQVLTSKSLTSPIITNLTASRIVYSDGTKSLQSIANLASWVAGTSNQIIVTDDGDGTITLSGPQDLDVTATPSFAGALIGATASAADFPYTAIIGSQANTGITDGSKIGVAGEALSDGVVQAIGVCGNAKSSGSKHGQGVFGLAMPGASADTGNVAGVTGYVYGTHAGGDNIAFWVPAVSGGVNNYSFKGDVGKLYNAGDGAIGGTFRSKSAIVEHSDDVILTVADLEKIHLFDVSVKDITVTLPSVASGDMGEWVVLVRIGTGNTLFIKAADADTILNSSAGGTIECSDASHNYSIFALLLVGATAWTAGPGCFGIWSTR